MKVIYTLLYTLPGIPSVYYGSEWGIEGRRTDSCDDASGPEFCLLKPESRKTLSFPPTSSVWGKYGKPSRPFTAELMRNCFSPTGSMLF